MESQVAVDGTEGIAAQDAKARRDARKARILGAGSDRLARITKTGRGGEADLLYSSPPKSLGGTPATSPGRSNDTPLSRSFEVGAEDDEVLRRADAAMRRGTAAREGEDDPLDVDISQQTRIGVTASANNPFLAMMGGNQAPRSEDEPQDLQGMMRAMQEAMTGSAGAGASGQRLNGTDGTQRMPALPFGLGMMGGGAQQTAVVSEGPSAVDTVFNLLRALVFALFGIALTYGALFGGRGQAAQSVSERASAEILDKFAHMTTLHRWARLAYERPAHWEARYFGVESFGLPIEDIPIFWLFITLEIGLSSARIMLQRRRPPPPGMLLKVAAFIPSAKMQLALRTLAAYLPLLNAFLNDLAIVVFSLGCAIMFAAWKVGADPLIAPSDGAAPAAGLADGFQRLSEAAYGAAVQASNLHDTPSNAMAQSPM